MKCWETFLSQQRDDTSAGAEGEERESVRGKSVQQDDSVRNRELLRVQ